MSLTETDICNQALDILERSPLTDMDTDDTPESRWFVRNFDTTRDAEVSEQRWRFAVARSTIAKDGSAPTFGWSYRYAVPADSLRVLEVRTGGDIDGLPIQNEIEQGFILCETDTSIDVLYVKQITDVSTFPALFVDAFAAKLAMKAAHRFSGKATMVDRAAGLYAAALQRASRANFLQGTPQTNDIINLALDMINVPSGDADEERRRIEWMIRAYETARDAEVLENRWRFAIARSTISVDGSAPTFGWSYRYAVPASALRMLEIRQDGDIDGFPVQHEIEQGYILTDVATSIDALYLKQVTDASTFPALFTEALAARLAMMGAHLVREQDPQAFNRVSALYQETIVRARQANFLQGQPRTNDVINLALDIVGRPTGDADEERRRIEWMIRNYAALRDAELRAHIWKFAVRRTRLYPRDFALAGIGGALTGAWGMVRLTEDWPAGIIQVRDASDDSSVANVGSADDGISLDTDAVTDLVGSGSANLRFLYDQSRNFNNLVQPTAANRPTYTEAEDVTGRPSATFDGTDDLMTIATASGLIGVSSGYLVIAGIVTSTDVGNIGFGSTTATSDALLIGDDGQKVGVYLRDGGVLYGFNDDGSGDTVTDTWPVLLPFVAELRHEGGKLYTRVNKGTEQSATSGDTSSLAGTLQIGDVGGSNALGFDFFAAMAFSTPPNAGDRDRLVERLMRYLGAGGRAEVGWDYRYPIPADCLFLPRPRTTGDFEGVPVPHEVENGYILTDQSSYLDIRYVERVTDVTRFDALFVQALAAALAAKAAPTMADSAAVLQDANLMYAKAIAEARTANAIEGTPERPYDNDVIAARYK